MIYCKKCTCPVNAVNLSMNDDQVCSACIVHEEKMQVNWKEREETFKKLLLSYKSDNTYDCIIPVSGGKDSTFQAYYIKNLGLNPLLVTYYTHNYTKTGEENLRNIGDSLGLDHYVFYPNKKVISKMNKIGFELTGDMSWHFHCGAWTVPFQVGVKFKIPLLIYGEHGFIDLAGQYSMYDFPEFTKKQRDEELMRGFSINDFIGKEGITKKDLNWAIYPTDKEIEQTGLRGIFMGNYVYWDANKHLKIAEKLGFKENPEPYDRTYRRFSNVDDIHENGIKDYLKFIKFGYGRCTDHTSKDIRLGAMTRKEGVELIKKYDHVKSKKSLDYFLKMTNMSENQFDLIADKFRDNRVWWIENNKWYKNTIWGDPESYGEVKLSKKDQEKYKKKNLNY
jgi:N-acetyl sugar amidotransferase